MRVRDINEADARAFASWTYPEPYSMYSSSPDDEAFFLDPKNGYLTVEDDSLGLVGFCCFGLDARVPGGNYDDTYIDLGTGMRPDLTGQGHGKAFFQTVIEEGAKRYPDRPQRTTVAAFNERARKMVQHAGFREQEMFVSKNLREFVIYVRPR